MKHTYTKKTTYFLRYARPIIKKNTQTNQLTPPLPRRSLASAQFSISVGERRDRCYRKSATPRLSFHFISHLGPLPMLPSRSKKTPTQLHRGSVSVLPPYEAEVTEEKKKHNCSENLRGKKKQNNIQLHYALSTHPPSLQKADETRRDEI